MANPFPFVSGAVLTAAQMNSIGEAGISYTPTLTQSNVVAKTVSFAKYQQVNKIVRVEFQLIVTGTGTAANRIDLTLPVTAANNGGNVFIGFGNGNVYDASSTFVYPAQIIFFTTTNVSFTTTSVATANGTQYLGISQFTAALAAGDYVAGSFIYEAA
jgi:hypothetical protein